MIKYEGDILADIKSFLTLPENIEKIQSSVLERDLMGSELAFYVDLAKLDKFNSKLFDFLFKEPDTTIDLFKNELPKDCVVLFENPPEYAYTELSKLRHKDSNTLICSQGILLAITKPLSLLVKPAFECVHCGAMLFGTVAEDIPYPPHLCSCNRKDFHFNANPQKSKYTDYIDVMIEESPEEAEAKREPDFFYGRLLGSLANEERRRKLVIGDRINFIGIVRLKQVRRGRMKTAFFENYIELFNCAPLKIGFDSIRLTKEEETEILAFAKNKNVKSELLKYFDNIYGMDTEKLACLLQLFEGTPKENKLGKYTRNLIHVALIGDTSVAKTELLNSIKTIHPRHVLLNADMVSRVGLTAMVEKDENTGKEYIRAGALMKASGGLCMINEFDSMPLEIQATLASPMEEGIMGLAKFAVAAEFRVTPSVLVAGNPAITGVFDRSQKANSQLPISPKLISRFDLIFAIYDIPEPAKDKKITQTMRQSTHVKTGMPPSEDVEKRKEFAEFIKKYIAYAKKNCFPSLGDDVSEAVTKLDEYYERMRKLTVDGRIVIKPRNYMGLIRLSEAHAKMHLRNKVTNEDIDAAISLFNAMAESLQLVSETGIWDTSVIQGIQPKTVRDKKMQLLQLIDEMQQKTDVVLESDFIEEAQKYGFDKLKTGQFLEDMCRIGEIFKPIIGQIKRAHPQSRI
jgi:replicative DNA helicase Mcm